MPLLISRASLCSALALTVSLAAACHSGQDPASSGAKEITPERPVTELTSIELLKDPQPAGNFSIVDLDGKTITSDMLRGKVVLVNFWATWCPPCRAEIPDLIDLQAKYKDDLVVLGISEDEAPVNEVRAFVAEHKINYFIAMTSPEVSKVFRGVAALPTTFVLDKEGKIVQRHVGQLRPDNIELEARYLAGFEPQLAVQRVDDEAQLRLKNAAQATEIPGVDLTKMTAEKRTAAIKAMNAENCTCGCDLTLAECRINDPSCSISLPLAKALAEKIASAN